MKLSDLAKVTDLANQLEAVKGLQAKFAGEVVSIALKLPGGAQSVLVASDLPEIDFTGLVHTAISQHATRIGSQLANLGVTVT